MSGRSATVSSVDVDRIRVRATFAGAKGKDAPARIMTGSRLALRSHFDIHTGVIEALVGASAGVTDKKQASTNRAAFS